MFTSFKINRKRILLFAAIAIAFILAVILIPRRGERKECTAENTRTLVIDAGHGGIDSGAVSEDGTKESCINLEIAKKLDALAKFAGIKTVLTRCEDVTLSDGEKYSEHEDLQKRTEIANSVPNAYLISIHQNYYPTAQPSGAQVLYADTEGSCQWGKITHGNIISLLNAGNRRVAAPAPEKLYLTANAQCPTILVECGFMSNNFEVLKLKDRVYQTALSLIMLSSYLQYINTVL